MRLLELFDSRDKKKRLSHIRNLVFLACSDGQLDKDEVDLIVRIGLRAGISHDELSRILKRPDSISFTAPDTFRERVEQLYDMVMVMMIDGELHENEITLCKVTAVRLGFRHEVIDKIVHDIINMIIDGIEVELALERLTGSY